MALDAPVQLEEVFVFEGGPDGFPELVLCHGIHAGIGYDLGVVAVDYFVKKRRRGGGWCGLGGAPRARIPSRRNRLRRDATP